MTTDQKGAAVAEHPQPETQDKPAAEKQDPKKDLVPVTLGDPKVFARIGADGRLLALCADVTLYEKLGHLYSVQGKTSITAAGYTKLNSIAAINVISAKPPKFNCDEKTGRLKSVEVRKMAIGFSPSGSLVAIDSSLVLDLDAYRLLELANLSKWKPTAVKFLLMEQIEELKKAGEKGWVVPYEDPVMLWINIRHEDVRDALIADAQRRKFAERIASTICWRNALKGHPAIAQAQVLTAGPDKSRTAVVRIYGFRHDLDQRGMERLASGIVEGKLDVVREQLKAIPGATTEVKVERHEAVAGAEEVEVESGAVAEEEEPAGTAGPAEADGSGSVESQEERERLQSDVQIGAEALNDQKALAELMAAAGVTDPKAATVAQLQELNKAISREVDVRATKTTGSKRTQGPKPGD